MSYAFTKIYECIKKAVKVHNTETQISVSLSAIDKLVWMHLLSKYLSFKNSGNLYFETQDQISESTGIGLTALKCSLRKLKQISVVHTQKKHIEKHTFYTVYVKVCDPNEMQSLTLYDVHGAQIDKSSFEITLTDPFLGR